MILKFFSWYGNFQREHCYYIDIYGIGIPVMLKVIKVRIFNDYLKVIIQFRTRMRKFEFWIRN
jgi:hypothetical protein